MRISNLQPGIMPQPAAGLSTAASTTGASLLNTLTGTASSISVPGGQQAFALLKNLLKTAGSIGAANTVESQFTQLATSLSGGSAPAAQHRPGAYHEQASLSADGTRSYGSTVSVMA
jgi:hypothetical protein